MADARPIVIAMTPADRRTEYEETRTREALWTELFELFTLGSRDDEFVLVTTLERWVLLRQFDDTDKIRRKEPALFCQLRAEVERFNRQCSAAGDVAPTAYRAFHHVVTVFAQRWLALVSSRAPFSPGELAWALEKSLDDAAGLTWGPAGHPDLEPARRTRIARRDALHGALRLPPLGGPVVRRAFVVKGKAARAAAADAELAQFLARNTASVSGPQDAHIARRSPRGRRKGASGDESDAVGEGGHGRRGPGGALLGLARVSDRVPNFVAAAVGKRAASRDVLPGRRAKRGRLAASSGDSVGGGEDTGDEVDGLVEYSPASPTDAPRPIAVRRAEAAGQVDGMLADVPVHPPVCPRGVQPADVVQCRRCVDAKVPCELRLSKHTGMPGACARCTQKQTKCEGGEWPSGRGSATPSAVPRPGPDRVPEFAALLASVEEVKTLVAKQAELLAAQVQASRETNALLSALAEMAHAQQSVRNIA